MGSICSSGSIFISFFSPDLFCQPLKSEKNLRKQLVHLYREHASKIRTVSNITDRVGSDRVGSGRVGSDRVGKGRVGSSRIGSDDCDPSRPATSNPNPEKP